MKRIFIISVLALLVCAGNVMAAPYYWAVNGHYYELVVNSSTITWNTAKTLAEQRTYNGWSGHLATITSKDEQDIAAMFDTPYIEDFAWIGAENNGSGWGWITGEAWSYTNWLGGSPGGDAFPSAVELWYWGGYNGIWNDNTKSNANGSGSRNGYLVEYEPSASAAPEPASLSLLGIGLLGLLSCRRSKTA